MGLQSILADYYRSQKQERVRSQDRLFLSDLGKCPRQIQYRVLGVPTEEKSESARDRETNMFSCAEHWEDDLAKALAAGGSLWAYQLDVEIPDRENWGGRIDILADYPEKRIIEVKTLNPNAFRHSVDYPTHKYQAWAYHHYLAESEQLKEFPLLVYFDRGSKANDALEQVVTPQPIVAIMDDLDNARSEAKKFEDVTYEQLPKVLKVVDAQKSIKLVPDSRCSQTYCDYYFECNPDSSTETWASRAKKTDPWDVKAKADEDLLLIFVDRMMKELEEYLDA